MKYSLLLVLFLAISRTPVCSADQSVPAPALISAEVAAKVAAADDERQAAIKAGDRVRLEAIFSDQLRYAHSNGKVDTKVSYIESLVSRETVYESFEYKERSFQSIAPGIVLMTGRVFIRAHTSDQKVANDLNFLSVWREENGRWRFLAWQSCKAPVAP